jgi:hypothetical protein
MRPAWLHQQKPMRRAPEVRKAGDGGRPSCSRVTALRPDAISARSRSTCSRRFQTVGSRRERAHGPRRLRRAFTAHSERPFTALGGPLMAIFERPVDGSGEIVDSGSSTATRSSRFINRPCGFVTSRLRSKLSPMSATAAVLEGRVRATSPPQPGGSTKTGPTRAAFSVEGVIRV